MEIIKTVNNDELVVSLNGRLDTTTAPELESFLSENLSGVNALTIDCQNLNYVSSAGLRVILGAQKKIKGLVLTNVQPLVMEVFEITGFVDILTIK